MIEARRRSILLRIAEPSPRITFVRVFAVVTVVRLIIGLWAARNQLITLLGGGGNSASGGSLLAVLLLGFTALISILYGLVAAAVVAVMTGAVRKLYVPRN